MNNLFAVNNSTLSGTLGLSGTAQLTQIASALAAGIINEMNADIEAYGEAIRASQIDNSAMDALIGRFEDVSEADVSFLEEIDEKTIDGMLKSQQSKRSRLKSKVMTLDNYKSMMTAAIAEMLIRQATGKEKHAAGNKRAGNAVEYTIEQLEQLAEDQEALRKEIRNVQSKKSIMKSKADFDETSERWQQLLRVEQQLKDMRVGGSRQIIEVDRTREAASELLADVNFNNLKADESKELLKQLAAMIYGDAQ